MRVLGRAGEVESSAMAWKDEDFHTELLEEFGTYTQSYDGGNVWLEQVEAQRAFTALERSRRSANKIEFGECLDCLERVADDRRRCAKHLAAVNERTIRYHRRVAFASLDDTAKAVLAERAIARTLVRKARRSR